MMNILITGAVIALGVIIYNIWNSDTSSQKVNQERVDTGEKGCMWLIIFLAGIALVTIIKTCTN